MRKGTALLTHLMAAACGLCLCAWSAGAVAADLEETESGAPSALVMFPSDGKSQAVAGAMKPVVFNHLTHEKAVENCETCHHTGDPESCSNCHTLTGSSEGGGVTLDKAMHARHIAPRGEGKNTPSSCVSCHAQRIASQQDCMGCHSVIAPGHNKEMCAVCHSADVSAEQLAKGSSGLLSADENLEIAAKVVNGRKDAPQLGYFEPTKVVIGSIADEYQPCLFNHRRHMASLAERIKDDQLARSFHSKPEVLCSVCHHHSPLSMNPPRCSSCHGAKIDPRSPGRPALKAAYHLQCMGCHDGMKVARPVKTNCTACHKAVEEK